ncbi:GTP pyrophosphokinase, (p)ppGpp synthetase I [Lachnospiraceae bacterium TWA4]|nr:GTP pyrophosphokinase, (p)ppGpp synthetase I [Lachnospiraceae bacterium TWA4]
MEERTARELMQQLEQTIHKYHPSDDLSLVHKAYELADKAHEGQLRKSGEPYIIHPLHVAIILAELQLDKESIVAGILHDVVEDTDYTREDIEQLFSSEVALLVDGVTKLTQLSWSSDKIEIQAENLRKMFLAMSKDIRVILIKLADRLHNMRTLQFMKPSKQKEKARETMEIYAPIAQRLGISKVKIELDDLALKYLEPEVYENLKESVAACKGEREAFINNITEEIRKYMEEAGYNDVLVKGRAKHFFSIYKKMVNQHKTLEQIYDLFAVRIIVKDVKDCYGTLGIIHEKYKPIPGRFKDYIAMPKSNGYQSLHTTLLSNDGRPFEIQIRTEDMHKTAEYGIAAHWKYKEGKAGENISAREVDKMTWLRQILEYHQDLDNKEFMSTVKSDLDLFSDYVYCFTPTGDIKSLPAGSTPIDFAYSIHSAVGNKMVGAKVNNRVVPIEYELKNGDQVAILTSQNSKGPSRDWLKIVKSSQARNKINQWFKTEFRADNILRGKEAVEKYCKSKGINFTEIFTQEGLEKVTKKYSYQNWDAILAAIGHGGIKEGTVINKLQEIYNSSHEKKLTNEDILASITENSKVKQVLAKQGSGFIVNGTFDPTARCSRCCNPLPGDEIVGFVTRGRGITVHRTDCSNILHLSDTEKARLTEVEWLVAEEVGAVGNYSVTINIYAFNRTQLLVDISKVFAEMDIDIEGINSHISKQQIATLNITFEINSVETLNRLTKKLQQIDGVQNIQRSRG